jgi:hypothetical protein
VARPKTKAKPERKASVQALDTPAKKPTKRKPAPKTAARRAKAPAPTPTPTPVDPHPGADDSPSGKGVSVSPDEAKLAEKFGLDLSAESAELPQTPKRAKAGGHRRGIRPKAGGRARRS